MQLGHFIKNPAFQEAIAGESQQIRDFFDESKNPVLPLGLAIPFGQFADADIGQGKMPKELIQKIVAYMNDSLIRENDE